LLWLILLDAKDLAISISFSIVAASTPDSSKAIETLLQLA
jgi:hypothetical protein